MLTVLQWARWAAGGGSTPPSDTVRPLSDVTAGGWTPSTGSSLSAMLTDPLGSGDSTYIRSANTVGPNVSEVKLAPMTDPGSNAIQIRIRHRATP